MFQLHPLACFRRTGRLAVKNRRMKVGEDTKDKRAPSNSAEPRLKAGGAEFQRLTPGPVCPHLQGEAVEGQSRRPISSGKWKEESR